jgi:ATP-binding protein involved in chromosome partitioning
MPAANDPQERAKILQARKKRLVERMAQIKHKFIVLSGKGGVGKSTVAAFIAGSLAARGNTVGLLDVDIHGPSIPKMLGIEDRQVAVQADSIMPVPVSERLRVMSIAFLLRSRSDAVIWRGPLKMGMIEEFLANVEWGALDYLIIDSPPGTGDEPLSVCQLVPGLDGAIVVATPQDVALADVEKSIVFCAQVRTRVVGVVENMSGLVCPHCGARVDLFKSGGAEKLAAEMGVPFLGRIPLVPEIVRACDEGHCNVEDLRNDAVKAAVEEIATRIVDLTGAPSLVTNPSREEPGRGGNPSPSGETPAEPEADTRKQGLPGSPREVVIVALPVEGGRLSTHFGHSRHFGIFSTSGKEILDEKYLEPPPHSPGVLPAWLMEHGVQVVLAGGMGQRAIGRFEEAGIKVVCGVPVGPAREMVSAYLEGTLSSGENVCDH